jgi:DNA (cytosine-5)-methyltransferase 1
MNELALFAGAGGGILGGHLLGWRTVCAVEWADYPRRVLLARQRDGVLPRFPIWDDVQTFDGNPWRGRVDVVSGGFPCQDISAAGKGAGIDGARSGMWFHMARIVREARPRFVFVENSPMLTSRGLGRVLGDLATMGYDAEWGVLGAVDVGAPHQRDRIWIIGFLADSIIAQADGKRRLSESRRDSMGWSEQAALCKNGKTSSDSLIRQYSRCDAVADADGLRELQQKWSQREEWGWPGDTGWWATEPRLDRMAHGVARRVDRLGAIGNGQVPLCAALAWSVLSKRLA